MGLSVYVHIPFCDYKCTFCDFATYTGQARFYRQYVDAVIKELAMRAGPLQGTRVSTVFFGGGTPTVLDASLLTRVLAAIDAVLPLETGAEISVESNPDTLDRPALQQLRAAGITRLSIGVQTLNEHILRSVHRLHSPAQALQAVRTARETGFASVNADLMFGLPGQLLPDWLETLRQILSCEPDHLSLYGLLVEDGALLKHALQQGTVTLPDDDDAASMYDHARTLLSAYGYVHYEISNWALPGQECRHNLTYWRHDPYLGLGLSAHSYLGGERTDNVRGLRHYLTRLEQGRNPALHRETIDVDRARADAAMVGLRLIAGIEVEEFDQRFGGDFLQDHRDAIAHYSALGLIEQSAGHIRLAPPAYMVANQVWAGFI